MIIRTLKLFIAALTAGHKSYLFLSIEVFCETFYARME